MLSVTYTSLWVHFVCLLVQVVLTVETKSFDLHEKHMDLFSNTIKWVSTISCSLRQRGHTPPPPFFFWLSMHAWIFLFFSLQNLQQQVTSSTEGLHVTVKNDGCTNGDKQYRWLIYTSTSYLPRKRAKVKFWLSVDEMPILWLKRGWSGQIVKGCFSHFTLMIWSHN